ncbi:MULTISPECIES: polysaccharide deacetylase family protein [unclassified Luteibacter]|uniref:polysaccharide deacetylase family protein n=1 Tax=Luteibacter sp. PvP019 TaxID=3156436 RepID=UPI0033940697
MDYHAFLSQFPDTYIGRGRTDRREIALTFDDGPGLATSALLAILREYDVQATFFCLGEKARGVPDMVRAIARDGHEVGNHGFTHRDVRALDTETFWMTEVLPARSLLEDVAGTPVALFRPPFGEISPAQTARLAEEGVTLVGWSIDPRDWDEVEAKDHAGRVVRDVLEQVHPGAIVLLHDGDEGERARPAIVEIVRHVVPALWAMGFSFVTAGRLWEAR